MLQVKGSEAELAALEVQKILDTLDVLTDFDREIEQLKNKAMRVEQLNKDLEEIRVLRAAASNQAAASQQKQ